MMSGIADNPGLMASQGLGSVRQPNCCLQCGAGNGEDDTGPADSPGLLQFREKEAHHAP